jgi:predicted transcriptional regulator
VEGLLASIKERTTNERAGIQKALHFSSPSVAQHHLEQLREMGLVQKQEVGGPFF